MRTAHLLLSCVLIAMLSACGGNKDAATATKTDTPDYPMTSKDERKLKHGKLTGEDGLFSWGGKKKDEEEGGSSGLAVNGFLWRATLDTLSFMPIAAADPFGGTILTDWYEDPATPGERFKVNAVILDKTLRSDGVRVSLFKQKKDDSGNWRDETVEPKLARQLEDTILTRARQMRVAQSK